jgi:hypothetical protein
MSRIHGRPDGDHNVDPSRVRPPAAGGIAKVEPTQLVVLVEHGRRVFRSKSVDQPDFHPNVGPLKFNVRHRLGQSVR